ncbi:hypothetical protein EBX31_04995 [bacterium]|nr:hypothetical protein [bacterium]
MIHSHPTTQNHAEALEILHNDRGAQAAGILRHIDGELDPESSSRAAHALGEFLRRIITPNNPKTTAIRFVTFAAIFAPELMGVSLLRMGPELGVTRAALSKHALALRQQFNLTWRGAKSEASRKVYRAAQLRAVAAGRHSLQVVARRKAAAARSRGKRR